MSKVKHCIDCGCELDEGEGQIFTCCEKCWDKKYPKETKMNWKDELKKLVPKKSSYDLISRTDAENFIESLLKKQRENCAEEYMKLFENCGVIDKITWQSIINAPEPGGSK